MRMELNLELLSKTYPQIGSVPSAVLRRNTLKKLIDFVKKASLKSRKKAETKRLCLFSGPANKNHFNDKIEIPANALQYKTIRDYTLKLFFYSFGNYIPHGYFFRSIT
jgi:hypothetical protein